MPSKIILSIIIPVYNAERYLRECLDSALRQLVEGVELVVVDDGSTDKSAFIVRACIDSALGCDQVKFLQQKNAGPGAARNLGLDAARGRYVGFLDSDDVLSSAYVSKILEVIQLHGTDLIEFPFQRFRDGDDLSVAAFEGTYGAVGVNVLNVWRERIFATAGWFPCTRVFRRKLFESNRFAEGVHYEDLMTIPFIYLKNLTIYFMDQPLYGYRDNAESITSRHTQRQFYDLLDFFERIDASKSSALAILKVRTGRSVVYFGSEFSQRFSRLVRVAQAAASVTLAPAQVRLLKSGDRFFYKWPRLYLLLDRLRVRVKHGS